MSHILSFADVTKSYGSFLSLNKLSFAVESGTLTTLLGPNGAGKTTAIQITLGLIKFDEGSVRLFSREPRDFALRKLVRYVPQEIDFPRNLSALEILRFLNAHDGLAKNETLEEVIESFRLTLLLKRKLNFLSGGERRLVALAGAFLGQPQLVILDEPSVGLDVKARREVWTYLRRYIASGGTILMTTHYLDEAEKLSDNILLLHRGQLVKQGRVSEIKSLVSRKFVSYEVDGKIVETRVGDADSYVRHQLVEAKIPFSNLEIRPASLEEVLEEVGSSP